MTGASDWAGKVAVVTGGGSGIGAALCRRFAEAAMSVVVADVDAVAAAEARLARPGVVLEPRKMWPTGLDRLGLDLRGRIAPTEPGRAVARLTDLDDLHLVVCSATRPKRARPFLRFARRLDIDSRVDWRFGLRHNEIGAWLAHAECSVAPLTDCPRNVEQGCCPLKVVESMAAGTPVIASDLPAVRELLVDGQHGGLAGLQGGAFAKQFVGHVDCSVTSPSGMTTSVVALLVKKRAPSPCAFVTDDGSTCQYKKS